MCKHSLGFLSWYKLGTVFLGVFFFSPLSYVSIDLGPNMITLNGATQGCGSGHGSCLGTSTLLLTVLQSLLWNFLPSLSYTCNSWPQIQPHILHGSYRICSHWTTHMLRKMHVVRALSPRDLKFSYQDSYMTLPIRTTRKLPSNMTHVPLVMIFKTLDLERFLP